MVTAGIRLIKKQLEHYTVPIAIGSRNQQFESARDYKKYVWGELAQLARALDLHSRGQGFDSLILHS